MKVGKFQIGRYHAIIRKSYADGSVDYETSFSDHADLMESVYCLRLCIGKMVGIATDTPKVLTGVQVIRGKENIVREPARGMFFPCSRQDGSRTANIWWELCSWCCSLWECVHRKGFSASFSVPWERFLH